MHLPFNETPPLDKKTPGLTDSEREAVLNNNEYHAYCDYYKLKQESRNDNNIKGFLVWKGLGMRLI